LNAKLLRGKTGLGLDISPTSAELENMKRENWTTQTKEKGGHTKKGRTTNFTN
jgi:hypothetical protein